MQQNAASYRQKPQGQDKRRYCDRKADQSQLGVVAGREMSSRLPNWYANEQIYLTAKSNVPNQRRVLLEHINNIQHAAKELSKMDIPPFLSSLRWLVRVSWQPISCG